MDAVDYILDGLEAALELERELGVKAIEIDRSLLRVEPAVPRPTRQAPVVKPVVAPVTTPVVRPLDEPVVSSKAFDFVFVHDRPLSPKGVEMMAKIITALGRTADTAPVIVAPPIPRSRIVVVLGALALRKYFPMMKGEPGQWLKSENGLDVLVTYSPEYILRFATVTPAVEKIKKDMWLSLKAVKQRLTMR